MGDRGRQRLRRLGAILLAGSFVVGGATVFANGAHAQAYGQGVYGGGDFGTGEVAAASSSGSSESSSASSGGEDPLTADNAGISLEHATIDKNGLATVQVPVGRAFTVFARPIDADRLQRLYIRVLGQEYELRDPNGDLVYTATLKAFTEAGSYSYLLTADYGTIVHHQKGIFVAGGVSVGALGQINALFRSVFGRTPTVEEWTYWAERAKDKPQLPALLGAMQWHKLQGTTIGTLPSGPVQLQEINSLFRSVYERVPTFSEWKYWAGRLIDKARRLPFLGALQWHFERGRSQ